MKEKILRFFKEDRSYENARKIYMDFGKKVSFKRQLNSLPEEHIKDVLFEELRELGEISPAQFRIIMSNPVQKPVVKTEKKTEPPVQDPSEKAIIILEDAKKEFTSGDPLKVRALIALALGMWPEDKDLPEEYETFINDEANYYDDLAKLPAKVKEAVKLRDEFPFLKEKDCPVELKSLVTDMVSAYDNYKAAHEKMFTAENDEELNAAAQDVVLNVLENASIWDELNHYKTTG